jgi:hypothetical protein
MPLVLSISRVVRHNCSCRTTMNASLNNNFKIQSSGVLAPVLSKLTQSRCFGKIPRKHGKKFGYTNDEVKLQVCYSDYDLDLDQEAADFDEELEHMTFARVKFDLSEIKDTVEEIFDDSRNLQYFDGKRKWRPLTDLSTINMQQYRGGKTVLKVRVPFHYDDTPMGQNDSDDDESYGLDDDEKSTRRKNEDADLDLASVLLEATIKKLVTSLKESNYVRSDGVMYGEYETKTLYTLTNTETNKKIMTKDFVMEQAEKDSDLARLLLALIGSLDHIVKCIHYDLLWEHEVRPKRLHNRYRRY